MKVEHLLMFQATIVSVQGVVVGADDVTKLTVELTRGLVLFLES